MWVTASGPSRQRVDEVGDPAHVLELEVGRDRRGRRRTAGSDPAAASSRRDGRRRPGSRPAPARLLLRSPGRRHARQEAITDQPYAGPGGCRDPVRAPPPAVESPVVHPAGTDPLIGRVLEGRYRIRARIAVGGMSTVYAAVDERLDREVAVKVMAPSLSTDPVFLDRFAREARTAAKLSHVNAVVGLRPGPDGGNVFLVMELVRGRTLRDLIRERGALSPGEAVSLMEPVLAALAAAHRAGLVHRDVKPENILLSDDGAGEGGRLRPGPRGRDQRDLHPHRADDGHGRLQLARAVPPRQRRRPLRRLLAPASCCSSCSPGSSRIPAPTRWRWPTSHVHQDIAPPSSRQRGVAPRWTGWWPGSPRAIRRSAHPTPPRSWPSCTTSAANCACR